MHGINELGHVDSLYVYPVILQAADVLAVSFTPVTYFVRSGIHFAACATLNYLG